MFFKKSLPKNTEQAC